MRTGMNNLGKALSLILCSTLLFGCQNCKCSHNMRPFTETITQYVYKDQVGYAIADTGDVYIMYGEYQVAGGDLICAGTEFGFDGTHGFKIDEVLAQYKVLATPQAIKAAAAQDTILSNVAPPKPNDDWGH